MNKFTHILEMTEKKKDDSLESHILLDDSLKRIKKYLYDIRIDEYEEKSKDDKKSVLEYDKQFFKENLPLQKIIVFGKDDIEFKTNPFKIIEFRSGLDTSYVDFFKILSGKYRGQIGFDGIVMQDKITKLSYGQLGHEIVHTQIEKNPNSLESFYNREVISMFIELVISESLDKSILDNMMRERFKNVNECLVYLSYYEDCIYTYDEISKFRCYLSSALKALHLYSIYQTSNKYRRMEILSLVEDIFRNRITVEEFLNRMHVTYDNSKDYELVKTYVKKYVKKYR